MKGLWRCYLFLNFFETDEQEVHYQKALATFQLDYAEVSRVEEGHLTI